MRITIFASGSRGDVQPLIALALGLQAAGHQVVVAAPKNFRDFIEGRGLVHYPFSVDVDEVMRSDVGRSWLGHSSHSPALEVRLVSRMVGVWAEQMARESVALVGTADLYISGVMTLDVVDALVRAGGGQHVIALLAPFHATVSGQATLQAPRPHRDSLLNHFAGSATELALGYGFGSPGIAARRALGLPKVPMDRSGVAYRRVLRSTPTILGVSPAVVPRSSDWPPWVSTTGFWHLPATEGWAPDPALADFLADGEAPTYVGFGSMSTRDPEETLKTIVAGLRLAGRRAVIHSGGADLATVQGLVYDNREFMMVGDVPHDWLFQRVSGVIHHGGAGTTAAGLHAGVPAGVVPHIGDQPYWGRRLADLGVGAAPVPRHRLTAERLATMITEMAAPQSVDRAATLGVRIRAERGTDQAVQFIERWH